jgi:type VI secretion system protein ImpA
MSTADASAPQVIDIEKLLAPISEENPVGEDLRRLATKGGKSILLDDIEERRRAIVSGLNENTEQGQQVDPAALASQRRNEWRDIERMVTGAFASGKELGAAVTLVLAAVSGRGWAALAPGFRFLRLLQERYFDQLYPVAELDDSGNPDYLDRLVPLERLDHESYLPLAIRQIPLTDPRSGGEYSWADFKQLEILRSGKAGANEDPEARKAMVEEKARALEDAADKGSLAYYDSLLKTIDRGVEEINALREFINERYSSVPEEERPSFRRTDEAIEEARLIAVRYWKKKGGGAQEEAAAEGGGAGGDGVAAAGGAITITAGDVVGLLEKALAHMRAHQKHNPAAFLVEEAIRWTKMPISEWYLETTNDPSMSGFVSRLMSGIRGGGAAEESSS